MQPSKSKCKGCKHMQILYAYLFYLREYIYVHHMFTNETCLNLL
jgi:hypothetical protein